MQKEERKNRRREERLERLDWWMTIGEFLLYLPRVVFRLFRRLFDTL